MCRFDLCLSQLRSGGVSVPSAPLCSFSCLVFSPGFPSPAPLLSLSLSPPCPRPVPSPLPPWSPLSPASSVCPSPLALSPPRTAADLTNQLKKARECERQLHLEMRSLDRQISRPQGAGNVCLGGGGAAFSAKSCQMRRSLGIWRRARGALRASVLLWAGPLARTGLWRLRWSVCDAAQRVLRFSFPRVFPD